MFFRYELKFVEYDFGCHCGYGRIGRVKCKEFKVFGHLPSVLTTTMCGKPTSSETDDSVFAFTHMNEFEEL